MFTTSRQGYLVRILVVTTMMWGFVLPVVHLACGMQVDSELLCDDMPGAEGMAVDHSHNAKPAVGDHAVHHAAADESSPCPNKEQEAGDVAVECCWVDANAVDHAPLPNLTQIPNLSVAQVVAAVVEKAPKALSVERTADVFGSPSIALRLLFSVFLI